MYHLLRNQSENVVYKNIKLLRDENHFFDVTLICEDGIVVSAHKLILASHSDKFKKILSQMSMTSIVSQQCIYLTGVSGDDLQDILEFMYVGEAKISQDRLVRFLNASQQLEVNGLMDGSSASSSDPTPTTLPDPPTLSLVSTAVQQISTGTSVESGSKILSPSPIRKNPKQSSSFDSPFKRKLIEPELNIKNEENDFDIILEDHNDSNTTDEAISGETESFDNYEAPEDLHENYEEVELNQDQFPDQELDVNKSRYSDKPYFRDDGVQPQKISFSKTKQRREAERTQRLRQKLSDEECSQVLLDNLKCLGLSRKVIKDTKSRNIVKNIMSKPTPKLPCPVALMSEDQILPWMLEEIRKDIIEQGKRPVTRIRWGEERCHPSFWPDDIFPWHLVTNPCHSQRNRPDGVSPVETWKVAINNRLKQKNIDPDTFISEDYTEREDLLKKRVRGITTKTS